MAGNPPARQFVQPRQRRIVFPDGVSHFYAASDAAVGPAEVALLDGSSALLSSAAKSEPVTHPAWVPTALPTRQPAGVPFPGPEPLTTAEHQKNRNPPRSLDPCGWPTGDIPPSAAAKLGEAIGDLESPAALEAMGRTFSLAVIHRGRLVHHQYGPSSSPTTRLVSWSMAKSFVHAMLGALVLRGILPFDLEVEAPLPEWKEEGKRGVAMRELVEMRSGRGFAEDYVDGDNSDVIQMLFRQGKDNPPGFALARPQVHPPGTAWYYSSGTSNILCLCISRLLPPGESLQSFFRSLLDSIGMRDADPRYDAQGVFVGSSFLYASALSFARMGLLYMRDGVWEGRRLLPQGWADTARTMQAGYPAAAGENFGYGWHWWVWMDPLVGGKWGGGWSPRACWPGRIASADSAPPRSLLDERPRGAVRRLRAQAGPRRRQAGQDTQQEGEERAAPPGAHRRVLRGYRGGGGGGAGLGRDGGEVVAACRARVL